MRLHAVLWPPHQNLRLNWDDSSVVTTCARRSVPFAITSLHCLQVARPLEEISTTKGFT